MQTLFQKWWVILVQGILLVILSFYVFNHPVVALATLSFWISLMILFAGLAGIIGWFAAGPEQRETTDLLWSIASALLGLLLLAKIGFAMDLFTNLLGIWMIITGGWLIKHGWANKDNGASGWITVITGVVSIIVGLIVIFNIAAGAVAVSTLVGLQLLLAGIGLIILSLIKRKVVGKVKDAAANIQKKFS
jgi:uncharacterized membrane protein HdeD (DUF308 family)